MPKQPSHKSHTSQKRKCDICHKTFAPQDLFPIALLRQDVTDLIHEEHPKVAERSVICSEDLQHYRSQLVAEKLKNREGSPDAHKAVIQSFRDRKFISRH
ncbi:MAG TPA: hypothetical protein VNJ29_00755, partial [Candidatus Nitrosotenuis sp.]|nr:hypothetical protein [Candidatus Nitrosotenuis sp.]